MLGINLVSFFFVLKNFFKKISFFRLLIFYYYFGYLYLIFGIFCVLQYAKISIALFSKQLTLFPSLHALFLYRLVSETIYESFFLNYSFVNFDDLFILVWSSYESDLLLSFFKYYLFFFKLWVT